MNYTIPDCNKPFTDYIEQCKAYIRKKRNDEYPTTMFEHIVEANSPFEFKPPVTQTPYTTGLLFIHGLLDSPFTMRELASRCAENNMLCRGVLLPGHGSTPQDLMHAHYKDWIKTVDHGVQLLSQDAKQIFLVGYSTGATLAVYHALNNSGIAGIILIAPAIKLKFPIDPYFRLLPYINYFSENRFWIKKTIEVDYTKYRSIPYHAVLQVSKLTKKITNTAPLSCPLFMGVSKDDETISADAAIHFFNTHHHPKNKLIIYTPQSKNQGNGRVVERCSLFNDANIDNFSHRSLLFTQNNMHYGKQGDFVFASHPQPHTRYGAYIGVIGRCYALLHSLNLTSESRKELTYNPDFDFLSEEIVKFVKNNSYDN